MTRKHLLILPLLILLVTCGPSENSLEGESPVSQSVTAPEVVSLEGTAWQLLRIQSLGGYEFIPQDPALYTLRFRSEGRLVIKSDCNTAGATWIQDGNQLMLEQFVTTRALCLTGTLHNHFVSNLINARAYTISDGKMAVTTSIEGMVLEFEPLG